MATQYKDVMKTVDDFFTRTFNFGHSVEGKVKGDAGVKVTATAKLDKGKVSTKVKGEADLFAQVKLDKLEFDAGKQAVNVEASYAGIPSTKVVVKGSGVSDVSVEAKTAQGPVAATVDAHLGKATGNVALAGTFKDFTFGAKLGLDTGLFDESKGFDLTSYDLALGANVGNVKVAAQTADKLANVTVGVSSKVAGATVVARAKAPTTLGDAAAAKPISVEAGFSTKVNTDGSFAATVNNNGVAKFGYTLAVNPGTKFAAATEVNLKDIGSDVHAFGTKFTMDF